MYKLITTEGTELGVTESVLFIKLNAEGTYITATEADAVGVAFKSTAYNLFGYSDVKDAPTVVLVKTTLEQVMQEQNTRSAKLQAEVDYLAMMADVDLDADTESKEDDEL